MDRRTHSPRLALKEDSPFLFLLVAVTLLSGALFFHGAPSFSPEDYVYTALGGDIRASLVFLADWRQLNYRPLSHGLVYLAMWPLYSVFGEAAFAWLVTILKVAVVSAFFFSLRVWAVNRLPAFLGAAFLAASGGWGSLHLWNALAINMLFFQLSCCFLLVSLASRQPLRWLAAATMVGSASYTVGAAFPLIFFFGRPGLMGIDRRKFLAVSFVAGFCGWLSLANSVHRWLAGWSAQKAASAGLSYHPVHLQLDPAMATSRFLESLALRLGEFLPFFQGLQARHLAGAVVFAGFCGFFTWLTRRDGALFRASSLLLGALLLLGSPFFFLQPRFSLRYLWTTDIFFCAFLAITAQVVLRRRPWVFLPFFLVWVAAIVAFPSEELRSLRAGFRINREISASLVSIVDLQSLRQGEHVCLPRIPDEAGLPERPQFPEGMKRQFYQESLRGIVMLSVLGAHGNLAPVIDRYTLLPHCEVAVLPWRR